MPEFNVIVYVMDSARYSDFMDIYTRFQHPLKQHFVAFPNAYSFGTWTKPASSSILFGLPARVTGMKVYNDAIPDELMDIYTPLRQRGLRVNLITTNVIVSSFFGYDRCFDLFSDEFDGDEGISLQSTDKRAFDAYQPYALGRDHRIVSSDVLHKEFLTQVESRQDRHITFIWSMDTHDPYYDLDWEGEPEEIVWNENIRGADPSTLKKAHELHRGSLKHNLRSFFALLDAIDTKRYQDTLIFLISDHGDAFGDRAYFSLRRFAKVPVVSHDTFPIQEIIRIPALVKFPTTWSSKCDTQRIVTTNSLLPTIFDVLDVEPQIPLWDTSLLDQPTPAESSVVCEHWPGGGPYTYIALVDHQNRWQFIRKVWSDQNDNVGLLDAAKSRLRGFVRGEHRILGARAIGHRDAARPGTAAIEGAIDHYLWRCGQYSFQHSKVEIELGDEEGLMQRLRALGYAE